MNRTGGAAIVSALLVCGCGRGERASPVSTACFDDVRQIVGAVAPPHATASSEGIRGCRYGRGVTVTIDSNPQALTRFDRAVEERSQVALWSHRESDVPTELTGIGTRADWFGSEALMLSTDGQRLVSVQMAAGPHQRGTARLVTLAVLRKLAGGR